MGACRKTKDLFFYLRKKDWKEVWSVIRNFDKEAFEDTFMPIVCRIFGHVPYIVDWNDFVYNGEVACKRCHKYIKPSILKHGKLSARDRALISYIETINKKHVKVELHKNYVVLCWVANRDEIVGLPTTKLIGDIKKYLKGRFIAFCNINGKQFLFFRYMMCLIDD